MSDENEILPSVEMPNDGEMTLNDYQDSAHDFAAYGDNPIYPLAGLAEEAGEVLGKYAKFVRKHAGLTPEDASGWVTMQEDCAAFRGDIKKELGDVLWMLQEVATSYGFTLEEIAVANIEKLADRKQRGVIVGEGDNR